MAELRSAWRLTIDDGRAESAAERGRRPNRVDLAIDGTAAG
jgi:hypothetical protein